MDTHTHTKKKAKSKKKCRDPGSNQGPSDLQSDALPTELSRRPTPFTPTLLPKNRPHTQTSRSTNSYTPHKHTTAADTTDPLAALSCLRSASIARSYCSHGFSSAATAADSSSPFLLLHSCITAASRSTPPPGQAISRRCGPPNQTQANQPTNKQTETTRSIKLTNKPTNQ